MRELLADLPMEQGQAAAALNEYEASIKTHLNACAVSTVPHEPPNRQGTRRGRPGISAG